MRQAIGEFLDNNDKEKQELWNNATFVFDTNILLDLYRYSKKTRDILLETMSKFSNRVSSHPDENPLLGQEEASLKIRGKSKTKLYLKLNIHS